MSQQGGVTNGINNDERNVEFGIIVGELDVIMCRNGGDFD